MKNHRAKITRLSQVWLENPVYFITICIFGRKPVLCNPETHQILLSEWKTARNRHGWIVGRYVVMPDHVHFFCACGSKGKPLGIFMGSWKEWTSKRSGLNLWQPRFFDHLLRSEESYGQKADYMEQNPIRAGLVRKMEDWPYRGDLSQG